MKMEIRTLIKVSAIFQLIYMRTVVTQRLVSHSAWFLDDRTSILVFGCGKEWYHFQQELIVSNMVVQAFNFTMRLYSIAYV